MNRQELKLVTVVGARPQFIKAATTSRAINSLSCLSEVLVHTGQHFDANMSDVFFDELDIRRPDYHLGIGGGTHGENTGRMLEAIENVLISEKPDAVLVFGDTDSTLAAALAAAKLHIPLAHVEAGLRSFNRQMPEEINRVLTDHVSDLLFVPTKSAMENLRNEGIDRGRLHLVGDVMYDASIHYLNKARKPVFLNISDQTQFMLCTIHRAENTDDPKRLKAIVENLNCVVKQMPVILPLHPRTAAALKRLPIAQLNPSITIIEPVSFLEMNWLLSNCCLVLTDSGGLQKEAFYHKKPCITLREETEWSELVHEGVNVLLSPFSSSFIDVVNQMMQVKIQDQSNLYGNGQAASQICEILLKKIYC